MMPRMPSAADKKRWDDLHAAYAQASKVELAYEIELGAKYGHNFQSSWLSKGQKAKLEKLRAAKNKIGDKIIDLLVRVSPRGDTWLSGVPSWWIREKLTWEDAIRPANETLSVVVPGSWGSHDGTMQERKVRTMPRAQEEVEADDDYIQIPIIEKWRQIGGDMDPGTYGALLARSDGDYIDLWEIQPVREFVGDGEAADVGFPFWTKEAGYDLEALDPSNPETKRAIESMGLEDALAEMSPPQRALAIAEALMRYGYDVGEGPAGWSKDAVPTENGPVEWWGGVGGPEYLADEDDEFRREVLGEEDEEEEDDEEGEESEESTMEEAPGSWGRPDTIEAYWDTQDSNNVGWAFRAFWEDQNGDVEHEESGEIDGRRDLSDATLTSRARAAAGFPGTRIPVVIKGS